MASSLALLPLILATAAAALPNNTGVEDPCSHTLYPDFCVKSLLSYPDALASDNCSLAGIAVPSDASSYSAALLQDGPGRVNPAIGRCLDDCTEKFSDAADQLWSSAAALDDKAYDNVGMLVKAAMADATSCNEGCKAVAPGGPTVEAVTCKSEDIFKLCDIALVLVKLLLN